MVFRVSRDARGVVIVTVNGVLAVDDRPVLCRAVEAELRRHPRRVVLDFGFGPVESAAVSAAMRVGRMCAARRVGCAVVAEDRDQLCRALAHDAVGGRRLPSLATTLAAALVGAADFSSGD